MTRRTPISKRVIHLLQERSTVGSGQDMTVPTPMGDRTGVVTAYAARIHGPSQHMRTVVDRLAHWLTRMGATSVFIETDRRHLGHPGCLTVHWNGPIPALAGACQVAVGFRDGLPVIPGWLSLVAEDDWDLRWQTPFGPLAPPMNPAQDALIRGAAPTAPPTRAQEPARTPATATPGKKATPSKKATTGTRAAPARKATRKVPANKKVTPLQKAASAREKATPKKATPKKAAPKKPTPKKPTPKKATSPTRATQATRPSRKSARQTPNTPLKRSRSRSAPGR